MPSVEEAKKRLKEHFEPRTLGVEKVPLSASYARVLAEEITVPLDVPSFDRATMDGYAVRAEDTYEADEENRIELKIVVSKQHPSKYSA